MKEPKIKEPDKENLRKFLDDNIATRIRYHNGLEVVEAENVPVMLMAPHSVMIVQNDQVIVVPWEQVKEIVMPLTDKMIHQVYVATMINDKSFALAEKSGEEKGDDHSFG